MTAQVVTGEAESPVDSIGGLSPSRIIEVARDVAPGMLGIEALLVVGSLAEGLGTPTSDIDLYMIVSAAGELAADEMALEVDGILVDIQFKSLAACARQLAAAAEWAGGGQWALAVSPFSESERNFLHRLLTGLYLVGSPDRIAPAELREAARRTLLRLKFETARHHARSLLVDAHGCFLGGDAVLAAAMAHAALHHSVDALTAALDETNINPKWRLRHLRRLAREGRLTGEVAEALSRLMMSGTDPSDAESCTAFAARAAGAVRALLAVAGSVIDDGDAQRLAVRKGGAAPARARRRLRMDLDFDVGTGAEGLQLRLLAGDKPPFQAPPAALAAVFELDPDALLLVEREAAPLPPEHEAVQRLGQWLYAEAAIASPGSSR
jgi:hypothetical protein